MKKCNWNEEQTIDRLLNNPPAIVARPI